MTRTRRDRRLIEVSDRLHSAAIHLLRRVRLEDEASGLSPARLSALSVVVFAGPLSLGELAAAEQVRPPTMSRLIDGLEADGLVARERDAQDRRVTLVRATPAGEKLMQAARRRRVRALADRLRGLDAAEIERLAATAEILEGSFGRGS